MLEDLSDLLQAQKEAAWGEVAQRIAHEIKNPLTPIALSAERIHLWLERPTQSRDDSPELSQVIRESCSLIHQEVGNLKRLVDEFSQLARFPKACPALANLNQIVESALGLFKRPPGWNTHPHQIGPRPAFGSGGCQPVPPGLCQFDR